MKKDFLFTYAVEGFVLLSFFLVFKFVHGRFGADEFSLFAISKRAISFILPVFLLGLSVGVPRYIAISNFSSKEKMASSYFFAGGIFIAVNSFFYLLIFLIFERILSRIIFGDLSYYYMVLPVGCLVISLGFYSLMYGYMRGCFYIRTANLYKLFVMGFIPLFSCYVSSSVFAQIYVNSFLVILFSFIFFLRLKIIKTKIKDIFTCLKDLLSYGIKRVSGDFFMAGILFLPVAFVSNAYGLKYSGIFAFGITVINVLVSALSPVGLILLPSVSKYFSEQKFKEIRNIIYKANLFAAGTGVVFLFCFQFGVGKVLNVFFGETGKEFEEILRIISISSVFMAIFVTNRSIFDALYTKAINSKNIFISFMVFSVILLVGWYFQFDVYFVAWAFVVSNSTLFFLTIICLRKVLREVLA